MRLLRGHASVGLGITFAILSWAGLTACVIGSSQHSARIEEERIVGKTKQDILACAGKPQAESEREGTTVLTYYKEASLRELSAVGSKGSRSAPRHACKAQVYLQSDHVTRLEYQSIPESFAAFDHCAQIFEACAP